MARRSRAVAPETGAETRRWLGQMTAATLAKSQLMSEEVYAAMLSRGYSGEAVTLGGLSAGVRDYLMFGAVALITAVMLWINYR
jgi:cobalt/nickel transport system permease protein